MKHKCTKKLLSCLLILVTLAMTSLSAYAKEPIDILDSSANKNTNSLVLSNTLFMNTQDTLQKELAALEELNFNPNSFTKINTNGKLNEYLIETDEYTDIITVNTINEHEITITVSEGNIVNKLTKTKDGKIFLDGNEVTITDTEVITPSFSLLEPRGTIYKSTKSTKPFASSYPNYLTSKKQNLALGKAIDAVAVSVLTSLLELMDPFKDLKDIVISISKPVYTFIKNLNPKTSNIGCIATTYTASYMDYKYVTKFYANSACTGSYTTKTTYEHFIIY